MSGNAAGDKGSKRRQHFYAALPLAIQRSAHKWTWDNFTESSLVGATDRFFDDTYLKQCIDDLHAAIVDAKLRNQKGEVRPDIWREGLYPRAATRARTVPLLEKDRERRLGELQEDENSKLQEEIASNVHQFDEDKKKLKSLLDMLEEVFRDWELFPADEIGQWMREMTQQQSTGHKSMIF